MQRDELLARVESLEAQLAEKQAQIRARGHIIDDLREQLAAKQDEIDGARSALGGVIHHQREVIADRDRRIERLVRLTIEAISCLRMGGYTQMADRLRMELRAATTPPETPLSFPDISLEALSARLHDIYQVEAHRRGDVRHHDAYDDLTDDVKEWDRVLARWILANWRPLFDPEAGIPQPHIERSSEMNGHNNGEGR